LDSIGKSMPLLCLKRQFDQRPDFVCITEALSFCIITGIKKHTMDKEWSQDGHNARTTTVRESVLSIP
jgi:hypothetical protein